VNGRTAGFALASGIPGFRCAWCGITSTLNYGPPPLSSRTLFNTAGIVYFKLDNNAESLTRDISIPKRAVTPTNTLIRGARCECVSGAW
jgi:hypothetical protein